MTNTPPTHLFEDMLFSADRRDVERCVRVVGLGESVDHAAYQAGSAEARRRGGGDRWLLERWRYRDGAVLSRTSARHRRAPTYRRHDAPTSLPSGRRAASFGGRLRGAIRALPLSPAVAVAPPQVASRAPTTTEWSEPKRGWAYCTTAEAKVPSPEPAGAAVVEISVGGGGSTRRGPKDGAAHKVRPDATE